MNVDLSFFDDKNEFVSFFSLAFRSMALDEQIRLVKQKKEEAEILRLQRFQELLKIKEQKWFVTQNVDY